MNIFSPTGSDQQINLIIYQGSMSLRPIKTESYQGRLSKLIEEKKRVTYADAFFKRFGPSRGREINTTNLKGRAAFTL